MSTVQRQIGPWGTTARVLVGVGFLAWAVVQGVDALSLPLGLGVFPVVELVVLRTLRTTGAPPLRAGSPLAHCFNLILFFVLVSWQPVATLLFYGVSMLVAAWQGFGACEIFALSNLVRRRDDQLGCPLFLPVDLVEARTTSRALYCS
jgi:hypothetical protein